MSGEDLYAWARALPHQEIPDYTRDRQYLSLLGRSAAAGYAPALAKLGEYAIRRATWVEAYYWMMRAKRVGMQNLDKVLDGIRRSWVQAGCPAQSRNVHLLFKAEDGELALALLHVHTGYQDGPAKAYLKERAPEYLE